MRLIRFLILFPFFLFPHADDMYLLKGGNVFLPDIGFVKKDILVDEGLITVSYTHLRAHETV